MKITLESTSRIVEIFRGPKDTGVAGRIWEGKTEAGVKVHVLITRIAVFKERDMEQFAAELIETKPASADARAAFPLHMHL